MASVVAHGRRAGQAGHKQSPALLQEQPSAKPRSVVVSRSEWERIRQSGRFATASPGADAAKAQERKRLHEESKRSVAGWGNTVMAQRQQKLEARKRRQDDEERRRVELDIEEARLQAAKRKEQIDRAKELMFSQNDRVKKFDSALMMTEMMRERERQLKLKGKRSELLKQQDVALVEYQKQEAAHAVHQEALKAEELRLHEMALAEEQLTQAARKRNTARLERERQLQEQLEIVKADEEFMTEEQQKQLRMHEHSLQLLADMEEQLAQKQQLAQRAKELEAMEEEKLQLYLSAKQSMMSERKRKKQEEAQQQAEARDKILAAITAQYKAAEDDIEERIAAVVAERERRANELEAAKQRRTEEALREIHQHVEHEQRRRAEARQREIEADLKERLEMQEGDLAFLKEEARKQNEHRLRAEEVRQYLASQAQAKVKQRMAEKEQDELVRKALDEAEEAEELMFRQYAQMRLNEAAQRGCRNLAPMVKAAAPSPGRAKLASATPDPHAHSTSQRLGFTWAE